MSELDRHALLEETTHVILTSLPSPGEVRLLQARLAHEYVDGAQTPIERAQRKAEFVDAINLRLTARHTGSVSKPVVENLLSTWSYILRSRAPQTAEVAAAAYNFASQGIADKEARFAQPAIRKILAGADPAETFIDAKRAIDVEKKARRQHGNHVGRVIDSVGTITSDFARDLTSEQRRALSDALASALDVLKTDH